MTAREGLCFYYIYIHVYLSTVKYIIIYHITTGLRDAKKLQLPGRLICCRCIFAAYQVIGVS